jgi:hypothetical protein
MTGPRIKKHAPQAVAREALARADAKLVSVRDLFASALLAHSRRAPDAAHRTREALDAIQQARDQLASIGDDDEA